MSKPPFAPEDFFVIRTPRLPAAPLLALDGSADRTRAAIAEWLDGPGVNEALYLASPSLLKDVDIWRATPDTPRGRKIEQALLKYMIRMTSRPTPFGLFSGIHMGTSADQTRLTIGQHADSSRKTRLDMFYLSALQEQVPKADLRNRHLVYHPNPSHYFIADQCRYIESYQSADSRQYRLSAVEADDHVRTVLALAATGASFTDLATAFMARHPGIERADIEAYIEQLIEEKLLLADLRLPLTATAPDDAFVASLEQAQAQDYAAALTAALARLADIDAGHGGDIAAYRDIFDALQALPVSPLENKLFQVDLYEQFDDCTLAAETLQTLARQIDLVHRLTYRESQPFQDFIAKFNARFEGQFVRLDHLLDEESGIGFSRETGYETPLIAGLNLDAAGSAPDPGNQPLSLFDHIIIEALTAPEHQGKPVIRFTSRELEKRLDTAAPAAPTPASFSAMLSLFEDENGEPLVRFRNCHGPSAANLLGRFSHLNDDLAAAVRSHLRKEEAHSPDVVFAEIVHIPDGRLGNVIARPRLRPHEIVFMADTDIEPDRQITISDLYVWIEDGKVKLWSKRLGKQIMPRLSSAHNFSRRSLAIYKFLSMIQHQVGQAPVFQMPACLKPATFLPRIMLDTLILSEKTWRIPRVELDRLLKDGEVDLARLKQLQARYQLDDWVIFSVGDNVLMLNLRNPQMLEILLAETRKYQTVELKEALASQFESPVRGADGRSHANEIIVPFFNEEAPRYATFKDTPEAHIDDRPFKRRFMPGSEWLSLKIYSGNSAVEDLLAERLFPMIEACAGSFDKWFFIRYSDPDWHIRLRFGGDPARLNGTLLPRLNQVLEPMIDAGDIQKVELFTYNREVERYGGPAAMEAVESLFMLDSDLVARALQLIPDHGEEVRWRTSLLASDSYLSLFGYDDEAKLMLMTHLKDYFSREFNDNAALRKQMGAKYREHEGGLRDDLGKFLGQTADAPSDTQRQMFSLVADWRSKAAPHVATLQTLFDTAKVSCSKDALLSSLLHMHDNRMFKAYGRQHEFVMHDFLRRFYLSGVRRHAAPGAQGGKDFPLDRNVTDVA